ncbi:response regulator transcription factor [Porifericola rhodea]|uniref:response regulator transcription factor n=1 Tax=Porifericola rhodea TaxID=930972 RepID=UPI0026652E89|nr:response regulator transcription factor [Porifericola rhodea]WKN31431.1 response regulator transcription factor [Porifericola rhodea]
MVRLLLVDDHNVVRDGLKLLLENESDINVIGEAENGREAITKITILQPDIVLLDIRMPRLDGLETLHEINKQQLSTRALVLSMYAQEDYVLRSAKAGASGYLLKSASRDELLTAIRTVSRGNRYFSGSVSGALVEQYLEQSRHLTSMPKYQLLTNKEKSILDLILQGQSNHQIAKRYNNSIRTIETHRFKIMKKMGVHKSKDMIKKAIEEGWHLAC